MGFISKKLYCNTLHFGNYERIIGQIAILESHWRENVYV